MTDFTLTYHERALSPTPYGGLKGALSDIYNTGMTHVILEPGDATRYEFLLCFPSVPIAGWQSNAWFVLPFSGLTLREKFDQSRLGFMFPVYPIELPFDNEWSKKFFAAWINWFHGEYQEYLRLQEAS